MVIKHMAEFKQEAVQIALSGDVRTGPVLLPIARRLRSQHSL